MLVETLKMLGPNKAVAQGKIVLDKGKQPNNVVELAFKRGELAYFNSINTGFAYKLGKFRVFIT